MHSTLFQQAVALHQAQEWQQALFAYSQLIAQFPDEPEPAHMLGVLHLQIGKPEKAIVLIQSAIKLNPDKASYHSNLGAAYRAIQNWEEAAKSWQTALQINPDDPDSYFNLGTLEIARKRRGEAKSFWKKALERNENHLPSLRALCMMSREDEAYEDALRYSELALTLQPKDPGLIELVGKSAFDVGLLLRQRKKWSAAVKRFTRATQLLPSSLGAWSLLSEAELKLGLLRAAFESCKKAIQLGPENPELHHNMGNILRMSGQEQQAIEAYERAIRLGTTHSATKQAIAVLRGEKVETNTEVVQALFDQYAHHFDSHLLDRLEYRGPQGLKAMLPADFHAAKALDLGCGTGLIAQFFTKTASHWVGVDLSKEMLNQTKAKGLYDELIHGEIVAYFEQEKRLFDLIVCADTLMYMAQVEGFFTAVGTHLQPSGFFLFSTEDSDTEDVILQKSERYALHPNYVKSCVENNGMQIIQKTKAKIRRDGPDWIEGSLWMCKKSTKAI